MRVEENQQQTQGVVVPNALCEGAVLRNGTYKIGRVLSRGDFSITYLGRNEHSNRDVVIKEFFPPDARRAGDGAGVESVRADSEQRREAFLREAQAISRVWHPNVVMVHDAFAENNTAYLVTKRLDGETLHQILQERELPESLSVAYALHIGHGLEAFHQAGLVHGDVQASNVIICSPDLRTQTPDSQPSAPQKRPTWKFNSPAPVEQVQPTDGWWKAGVWCWSAAVFITR
jgi:serine/threonine protein kinase